jgi:hypothetical protein
MAVVTPTHAKGQVVEAYTGGPPSGLRCEVSHWQDGALESSQVG